MVINMEVKGMKGTEKQIAFVKKLLEERGLSYEWAEYLSQEFSLSAGWWIEELKAIKRNADPQKVEGFINARTLESWIRDMDRKANSLYKHKNELFSILPYAGLMLGLVKREDIPSVKALVQEALEKLQSADNYELAKEIAKETAKELEKFMEKTWGEKR
ncbi:MAG: hypothetical protein ACK42C_00210 [Aquificaceae bacterium]